RFDDRLPENTPGDFYVDSTCIDCDTCRQIAPDVFAESRRSQASYVSAQPVDGDATFRALKALVACPTASIGTTQKHDVRAARAAFPELIASTGAPSGRAFGAGVQGAQPPPARPGAQGAEPPESSVFYCGYCSES